MSIRSIIWVGVLILTTLLVSACSDDADMPEMLPQQWQDLNIVVQTRPVRIRQGMTEFLVIATTARGLPGDNMVASLRARATDPWAQAIQDGHSGVYRRAILIRSGQHHVQLQLKRGAEQIVLEYPLLWED